MNQTLVFKFLRMLQPYANYQLEGTPVNLDKFHYTVTERSIEDIITANSQCSTVGFNYVCIVEKITDDSLIFYAICVNYVGECEGTIYPGEVKKMYSREITFLRNLLTLY